MISEAQKEEVWNYLSDLYLDTELQTYELEFIADKLAKTDLSSEELERILFDEVHPVCCWNLTMVAGQWGGFDKESLVEAIYKNLSKEPETGFFKRYKERQFNRQMVDLKKMVKIDWEKIKLLIELIRNGRLDR